MRKLFHKVIIFALSLSLVLPTVTILSSMDDFSITAEAHSGRTDSSGGHKDNKNKSGLGSYHYHCGGNPAHLHEDSTCPYATSQKEESNTTKAKTTDTKKTDASKSDTTSSKKDAIDTDTIKKVQNKLNDSGYDCGKADGKIGKKTKNSIKKFQEDNDLTIDGEISKEVLLELDIS